MIAKLEIRFFGAFEVILNDVPVQFRTKKARALLVHLAMNANQPHSRTFLTELLWQDVDKSLGRGNLRKTLSHLRKNLQDSTNNFFVVTREHIQFNTHQHNVIIDTRRYAILMQRVAQHKHLRLAQCFDCTRDLKEMIDLHRGELLDGFIVESINFTDRYLLLREQYYQKFLSALNSLAEHAMLIGFLSDVLYYAQQHVKFKPWSEQPLHLIMQAHCMLNEPEVAIQEYEQFALRLKKIIRAEPSAESQHLLQEIKDRNPRLLPDKNHPTNLPAPQYAFFGRNEEIRHLSALLIDPNYPWVTLIGEGGIGKTTLAETVGRRLLPSFDDGIWIICFAHIKVEGTLNYRYSILISAIATALNLLITDDKNAFDHLVTFLADKQILLILDNLEHINDSANFVGSLLDRLPNLKILTTSRRAAGGNKEHFFQLEGLATQAQSNDQIPDSVALFNEYAARITGDLDYRDSDDLDIIAELCRFLSGNPLGIRLTAAQASRYSPEQMLTEITTNLNLLTSNLRHVEPRHRSMRAAYDFSWDILPVYERKLLAQLAVIEQPLNARVAHAVAQASPRELARLVEQSLLKQTEAEYDLHPLLRQYSLEKLAEIDNGELLTVTKTNHSKYYLSLAANFEDRLHGPNSRSDAETLRSNLVNIASAWRFALANQHAAWILDSAPTLERLARMLGTSREVGVLFELAVAQGREWQVNDVLLEDGTDIGFYLATMQLCAAYVRLTRWHLRSAERMIREALMFARKTSSPILEARGYIWLGTCLMQQGAFPRAQKSIDRALEILQHHDAPSVEAHALTIDSQIKELGEQLSVAESQCRRAIQIAVKLQDNGLLVELYKRLGKILMDQGDFEAGKPYYQKAQALAKNLGHKALQIELVRELAINSIDEGMYEAATEWARQLRVQAIELGHAHYKLDAQRLLGQIASIIGDFENAEITLSSALETAKQQGWNRPERTLLRRLSNLYFSWDKPELARSHATQSYERAIADGSFHEIRSACILLGNALTAQGKYELALESFEKAVEMSSKRIYWKLEPTAGMLYARYKLGYAIDNITETAIVEMVMVGQNLYSLWQPASLILQLAEILSAAQRDDLANTLINHAVSVLNERASRISVPELRELYTTEVSFNARLLALGQTSAA